MNSLIFPIIAFRLYLVNDALDSMSSRITSKPGLGFAAESFICPGILK